MSNDMQRLAQSVDNALYGNETPFQFTDRTNNRSKAHTVRHHVNTRGGDRESLCLQLKRRLVQIVKLHRFTSSTKPAAQRSEEAKA